MGIIVRNLNNFSHVRLGSINRIVPFSFDASLLTGDNSIEDIIVGDGSGESFVSGTYNVVEGVEYFKYVQFTDDFVFNFDCENPILVGKNFRSKSYQFIPNTTSRVYHCHNQTSQTNRLIYGCDSVAQSNIGVWNNNKNPRLNSTNTSHIGKWCEIVWTYNNGVWRHYVDGIQTFTGNWSIQNYSKVSDHISTRWAVSTRLKSYKIQIEGINWDGNFDEVW